MNERAKTAGTKTRSNRSVNRCVGDFCVSAPLTIFTTVANELSLERRVPPIPLAAPPLMLPADTRDLPSTATGLARTAPTSATGHLATGSTHPDNEARVLRHPPCH